MAAIRTLGPGDEPLLEQFLEPVIDSSIFLLSNSRRAGLIDRGERFEGTYFAAGGEGRITGVAAHYWLGNLIFQSPVELVPALVAAVAARAVRPVGGVLGPAEQVAAALATPELAGAVVQLDEVEGLYSVKLAELALPAELAAGRLRGRRIERRDLERVSAWRLAYHLEALHAADTPELRERCRRDIEASYERGETWVLEDGGELVASTSFNAAITEAVQVGGVWTPPALRGRGYGRAVVAASLLDARTESVDRAILFTGDDNLPAIRAYAALGFRRIGDYRVVLFRDGRR